MTNTFQSCNVREKAKIGNRYNQVPHLTQDIIWESDKSTRKCYTQESQEANPYPTVDPKSTINRHQRKQNQTQKSSTKEAPSLNGRNKITGGLKLVSQVSLCAL